MREQDIRPDDLLDENRKLFVEDIKSLLKDKDKFIEIPCPACESENYKFSFDKNGFTFVSCADCEAVFINPRPCFDQLKDFYSKSESIKHWNEKIFPSTEEARTKKIFIPRVEKIIELCKKYDIATKTIADIGAGFGTFCKEIAKRNIFENVIAVEPSPELAGSCQNTGVTVINKSIEEAAISELNVITNFELIEHLFSPKDFLIYCNKVLMKDGLLILTTPNIKGFDLLVLEKLSNNINGPNHLNYFNPSSISKLLERCGFEILELSTPGKLDAELVRNKILNNELDISNQSFLKYMLIDEWEKIGSVFQQFLAENNLSSNMWVVAKKIR